ncbi:hypothetical protein ADILRU_0845 [Leifsonia rubra CMS 76R]|nr:hypothetical protein ADILRU_0845 [Leifsonia rubra CMS 76R]
MSLVTTQAQQKVRFFPPVVAESGDGHDGWLSIVRILFAWYLLTFAQIKSASSIADLPDAYFEPPLGPLMFLGSAPSALVVTALQIGATVGLVLLLIGYRTMQLSYVLPVIFIVLAGIRFSTGKIDHDILIYLLPIFLARSWGARLAVRPERYIRPRLDVLALFLGFFFLSSGVIKALSGWLDWDYSATAGWLAFYQTNYGVETPLAAWLGGFSGPILELLDWATVVLECSILPLLLFKRTVAVALLFCLLFNVGVLLLFGIDFAELFPVYLALLPLAVKAPKQLSMLLSGGLLLVAVISASLNSLTRGVVTLGPFGTNMSIFWVFVFLVGSLIVHTAFTTVRTTSGYNVPLKSGALVVSILSVPLLLTLFWSEPYPAIIGPGFRGGITGELKQVWMKDGREAQPSEVFGGSPYSKNIGFFGWPSPEGQGHEFRPWDTQKPPELPDGVTVEWIRVR